MNKFNLAAKDFTAFCSKHLLFMLLVTLVIVSLYDLFSPPVTRTMWRQTQTAMLTENFAKAGFSPGGLHINLGDQQRVMTVYEFPVYNFIVGLLFLLFNNSVFFGKLVSLSASLISLFYIFKLCREIFGEETALFSAVFFIFSPIGLLVRTSFQPDALSLMFILLALDNILSWREKGGLAYFILFSLCLMLTSLIKVTTIIPYLPAIGLSVMTRQGRLKLPELRELLILLVLVVVPFLSWYFYRLNIADLSLLADDSKFFIGDIGRFFSLGYYLKPALTLTGLLFCGIGFLFFLLGVKRLNAADFVLLLGLPLFFIMVPTVSDQYYYYYAILPVAALFMSRGFLRLRKKIVLSWACLIIFMLIFFVSTKFVLRHDMVTLSAARAIQAVSAPSDLVYSIANHDRGISMGSNNTSLFYLANRKGWALPVFEPNSERHVAESIEKKKKLGARWLVISWYTAAAEPWFAPFTPKNLRRDPGVNGKELYNCLKMRYKTVKLSNNYAVMKL